MAHRLDRLRLAGLRGGRRAWQVTGRPHESVLYDRHARLYRRIWGEAAAAVGANVEELGDEFLLLRRSERSTIVRFHLVMLDHPATTALALDKAVVHRLLRDRALPIPNHNLFDAHDQQGAEVVIKERPGSFVVKPANGTGGGSGVTCGVETPDDLARAWAAATAWDNEIMVEETIAGDEYRLLFLDGELLDVVRRRRPTLTGDGHSSVLDLIVGENRRRIQAGDDEVARLLRLDLDAHFALRAAGYSVRAVPAEGASVVVKGTVGENARADNTGGWALHPSIVKVASSAVDAVRLRLAGVDLVTPDPNLPLDAAGGAILEVNGTPGFHYHYEVAGEPAMPVATAVLERLLDNR
jgi:glutathione synthase/RimK-type ligase-like ATP-grasp enzyme